MLPKAVLDRCAPGIVLFMAMFALALYLGVWVRADAQAAVVSGGFTLPTSYTDGSPLPVANIKHIRIEIGTCATGNVFGIKEGEALVPPPTLAYSATVPRTFGLFCARGQTETTLGTLSAFTLAVSVNKPEPPPGPPVLATPRVAAVFELVPDVHDGVRLGRNVGWVNAGTKCDDTQPVAGWYEVANLTDVHFTKVAKSPGVVAQCVAS